MRLLILSDLHLEFAPFELPKGLDFDVAILAGDIHSPGAKAVRWAGERTRFGGKPVVYVPGNHELYDTRMDQGLTEMRAAASANGVHLLDGDQVVINGVRFLGATLWTDFELAIGTVEGRAAMDLERTLRLASNSLNDYTLIRTPDDSAEPETWRSRQGRRLHAADTRQIHLTQREWLRKALAEKFAGPTVVVTHHAPHRGSLADRHARDWVFRSRVSELPADLFEVPTLWVHGHIHQNFDYRVGSCRVVTNPRGYVRWDGAMENTAFDPGLVVELPGDRKDGFTNAMGGSVK
ncbi:metallophosphoesterase [Variovorax sp. YR216]|uniref:metallophosphoesterase n=1 Tax=Variovorax sp. YR216 TaxID=1882828 RepID=UPI000896FF63|nr:metallophosphoesterase [Variovorax sp. YR216]SEA74399.1 Calcineurin-like phosphoesterase [Variovorax sp. YR216]